MSRGDNQKLKMLILLRIMSEETDDQHKLSMQEIVDKLKRAGVHADRKTLYADFEELQRFGIDIIREREGRSTLYYMGERHFELAELKILVDSVEAAKFMTDRKSKALIKKLSRLVSKYDAHQLERQVEIDGRVKAINRMIYNNVDAIHMAIGAERQITFQYCQWDMDGNMVPRNDGALYQVSPWCLMLNNEYYYLIAYDSEAKLIKHYRVDKMQCISQTDKVREGQAAFNTFDLPKYAKSLFGMFSGEEERVTIECHKDMIGVLIDRFGKDVTRIAKGEADVRVYVNVVVSRQFLGWLIGLGEKVKIIGPESVVNMMKDEVKRLNAQYLA